MATFLGQSNFNGSNGKHYTYLIRYDYDRDIVNNITTLTLYAYIVTSQYGSAYGNSQNCYINELLAGSFSSLSSSQEKYIGNVSISVKHNDDGTFPATTITGVCETSWTGLGSAYVYATITSTNIPTIPRASKFSSIPNFTFDGNEGVGVAFNIPVTKYASSFYNVLKISVLADNNTYKVVTTKNNFDGGNITFTSTELNIIYNAVRKDPKTSFKFELTTYSDNAKTDVIGTDTASATGSMSTTGLAPTFDLSSVTYEDTNAKTFAITNNKNIFIKNYSDIKITFNSKASGNKGAIIGNGAYTAQVTTKNGIKTQSLNHSDTFPKSLNFEKIADNKINVFVSDSRNSKYPSADTYQHVTMWDYKEMTFDNENCKVFRTDGVDASSFINLSGTYHVFSEKANANTITKAILKYREKGSSSNYTSVNITSYLTVTNGVFQLNNYSIGNFDVTKEFEFVIEIEDKLSQSSFNLNLNSATPYIWHQKNSKRMGIGGKPNDNNPEMSIQAFGGFVLPSGNIVLDYEDVDEWE